MSYNITSWRLKKMEDLVIPMSALKTSKRNDWVPTIQVVNAETMEVKLECGCEQTIKGIVKDGNLHVSKMDMAGEGSGSFMYYVLEDALKQSTGELEAVAVWEGGDTIQRISVKDGNVEKENVDL